MTRRKGIQFPWGKAGHAGCDALAIPLYHLKVLRYGAKLTILQILTHDGTVRPYISFQGRNMRLHRLRLSLNDELLDSSYIVTQLLGESPFVQRVSTE